MRRGPVDDPDAIVEPEQWLLRGMPDARRSGGAPAASEFAWPERRPALVQGKIAGVPVKVWLADVANGDCLLVATAYADELADRLGWSRLR